MESCLYEGSVIHRRLRPVLHEFRYRLFLVYLDLAELDLVFRGRWLWSTTGPALAWFRRSDHLGDPALSLDESVRLLVSERLGSRPDGPIRLLTHLRYFGYVLNPVSFYFCYSSGADRIEAVVAEVNNTPWGERHCYVLDFRETDALVMRARHRKEFHVSPFMGMDLDYDWMLTEPGDRLAVAIENLERGAPLFSAKLNLDRRELTGGNLARALARYPLMTCRVFGAIYWQALRLWWKKVPYVPHPGPQPGKELTAC